MSSVSDRLRGLALLLRLRVRRLRFLRGLQRTDRPDLVRLGSIGYGEWVVAADRLGPDARCFCAGVGEDISFDLALIARFGCIDYAFDPVPRSVAYAAAAAAHEPRFVFSPTALWSEDTTLRFHAPVIEGYVSHSATGMHGTEVAFEAPARSVRSLMDEHGFESLDLLKISVEGSEYTILDHVLAEGIDVHTICVEFAQPAPVRKINAYLGKLRDRDYAVVDATIYPRNWRITVMRDA